MTMTVKAIYDEVQQTLGTVPAWVKQVPEAALPGMWATMRDFYLAETAIPNRYKELIGLAVAGATRCKYCALFHTEAARFHGATDAEIAEASYMGSFTMLASTFINAEQIDYDQFLRETLEIIKFVRTQQKRGDGRAQAGARQPHA